MCYPTHRNIVGNYYRLKNGKYRELRKVYPNIPSHYVHGVCQDAVERVSSLRRNKARQYSREIFDELVKHLGLGKRILGVGGSGDISGRNLGRSLGTRLI
ncbi:MAG: hypothetical protein RQ885_04920 [Desulfurococcales archaeon]|jgi:hypothetical protein|nr:hypothetical protein [Desulfurococcales archaeon]